MEDPNVNQKVELSFANKPVQPSNTPTNFQNNQNNIRNLVQPR
jgi:hypothetical protein